MAKIRIEQTANLASRHPQVQVERMSKKKSRKPTRKRRPGQEKRVPFGDQPDEKAPANPAQPLNGKKDLSPLTVALILGGFAIVIAVVSWFYFGQQDKKLANETEKDKNTPDKAITDTTGKQESSRPAWANLELGNKNWETESTRKETWNKIDNPSEDGWDTEVFNNLANEQWTKLKKLLASTKAIDESAVEFLIDPAFDSPTLLPPQLETPFEDATFKIQRLPAAAKTNTEKSVKGRNGFAENLLQMLKPFSDREKLRIKIKVFRVKQIGNQVVTRQSVEIFGPTATGVREENAIWMATWTQKQNKPKLQSIELSEYESVEKTGKRLFSDVTLSAMGKNPSFTQQLLLPYDQYLDRMQFNRLNSILGTPGIAIGDVNGDDLEDVYLCQESGLPNLLYLQNEDGTLKDFSKQSGTDWLHNSGTALIVDIDNDGHNDLAVGVGGGVALAKGDGTGKFELKTILDSSDHVMSISAADYNRDGRLDLYIGAYYPDGIDRETEDVVSSSRSEQRAYGDADDDGAPNKLFENVGDEKNAWQFKDVTEAVGLNVNNLRLTLASAWEDFDNDGDQDLYVANDYGLNSLYRNDSKSDGTAVFVDISEQAKAEDSAFGMSVAWGDYDRDGWMDLYISNMFSYAGNRITFQDQFQSTAKADIRKGYQRFARGNTLLRNRGKSDSSSLLEFQDQSLEEQVNRARWAWGSRFVDLNNDGWDDLVVANGYISTSDTGDL